ncbi:PP2C family protein-serine/threonine phosphatase [Pullulanibacillus sp. KACC 23026]|uniref:PP2C family protein-serine/threonine phosphatase n=1 Tax=Pullulanibacillus sp. KACC 23026 TaxID=3028315 RepID=UPI0023B12188|nr:PP2C family protein-serine/threonine phosphatase [Pullulanibacillus sp. KACC 23026]WEG12524.1 PP2C family protein-serine/threonine phosphatase [Pullulanibacillus sp. KACC 23026]
MAHDNWFEKYQDLLDRYIRERDETTLYKGQILSRYMLEQSVSPDEVISLHIDVLNKLFPEIDARLRASFEFLLEVMIGYGFAYREHQSLRDKQQQLDSELEIAANVQKSLFIEELPNYDYLDIGVISKPARKMSGDYYHFVKDDEDRLSVAIADIIGKGIPAAMSMSMIKYSMDSLSHQLSKPSAVLESLNRVVEQNVDPSMFITMYYGLYDPETHLFTYSSAGHEPGFLYNSKTKQFEELVSKGRVLGLSRGTVYQEYEVMINPGDAIILFSDGVTECRAKDRFIEREEVAAIISRYLDQPAADSVQLVYKELERLQDFRLRDDFTLVIMKRQV